MESSPTPTEGPCLCNGIRFCSACRQTERVRRIFDGQVHLQDAAAVIENQQKESRTSSVSFALIKPSIYSMCPDCGIVFLSSKVRACSDHDGIESTDIALNGAFVVKDFLSAEEEASILGFLDNPIAPFEPWKESLSGRRKHEYGPKKNFKKKKVKPADLAAMPMALKPALERASEETLRLTKQPYHVAEASILEYEARKLSNIDPHIDDTWLWGDRIAGINLCEDCAITFVNKDAVAIDVHLPRRSFFLMSGDSRSIWMHGIRPENVHSRRVSITLRELSDEIRADGPVAEAILAAAANYL